MSTTSAPENASDSGEKLRRVAQRERNRRTIERTQFNYLYITGSEVFHRRTCKLCLNAQSPGRIFGSAYYETAAKGRRPCKRCRPVPKLMYISPPEQKPLSKAERNRNRWEQIASQPVKVKMLTGKVITIRRGRVLGWCRHQLHPGAVSKSILDAHDCLGKNCSYFERNPQSPYWQAVEGEAKAKKKKKDESREGKRQREQEERELLSLNAQWQALLDETESDLQIVRVARESEKAYKIFYVSDSRCADWDRYTEFLDRLKALHPDYRITLRHIRDVDGHLVTREEYRNRRRR